MSTRTEFTALVRDEEAQIREATTTATVRRRGWISRYVIWLWAPDNTVGAAREACEKFAEGCGWQQTGYYSDPYDAEFPASSAGALDQLRAAASDVIVTTLGSMERMTAQQRAELIAEAEATECSVSVIGMP